MMMHLISNCRFKSYSFLAVTEQGVLKWSPVLVTVIVLLINATRTACVLNLISVPCRALGNVLIVLALKPVVKLFSDPRGQEVTQEAVVVWDIGHCWLCSCSSTSSALPELWECCLCFGICYSLAMEIELEFQANKTELWLNVLKMIEWVIFYAVSFQYLLPQGLFTVE